MKEQLPFQLRMNQNLTDLNPVVVGEGRHHNNYYTGPVVAGESYMIHYVRCGSGEYLHNGTAYPFHAGQLIISKPGDIAKFHSGENGHWALRWISFNGSLAHRFSELPPVVDAPPGTFENLCDLNSTGYLLEYKLSSELLFLYSTLLPPQKQKIMTDPVEWVKEYVAKNYMNHISVVDLAKQVGLDADYLTRKFKKQVNLNIQSYIIQTRITNSRTFLAQGYSVKETAAMCGFNEVSSFSRAFQKFDASHRSPSNWQHFYIEFHRKRKESHE